MNRKGNFSSKLSQHSDKQHAARAEKLVKWKTEQEKQFMEVEKLLSGLLNKGSKDNRPQYQGNQVLLKVLIFSHISV